MPDPTTDHRNAAIAPLLWVLLHHLGSNSPVGQPIRCYLGMGQFERMTPRQIEAASSWADSAGLTDPIPSHTREGIND
jgi:hypothetical protein